MSDPKHIVVTGANRGLGLEFVRQFAARGDQVVATARDPEAASELQELAAASGGAVRVAACDVLDGATVDALASTLSTWPHVDVLVNNAGDFGAATSTLADVDFAELERTFSINVTGQLRVTRALWPLLTATHGARIAYVTSLMGSIADSSGGRHSYRISKAGLNMAVRCLGFECDAVGRDLVAFTMHPGWVRTRMGGAAAPLSVEESVAAMVATIGSRTAEHNGLFFDRDGGPLPW